MKAGGELAKHREEAARNAVLFSQNFLKEKGSILGIQQVLITEDKDSDDVKIKASFQNSGLGSVEIFDLVLKTMVRFLGGPNGELFKELKFTDQEIEDLTEEAMVIIYGSLMNAFSKKGIHAFEFNEFKDPYVSEFFEDFSSKAFVAALSTAAKNRELMLAEEVEELIESDEDE